MEAAGTTEPDFVEGLLGQLATLSPVGIFVAAAWVALFLFRRCMVQLCSHVRERRWPARIGLDHVQTFRPGPIRGRDAGFQAEGEDGLQVLG
jgi:hypothetical protein